jgi:anti-sigma regulatory factor (Ser/Thr protein kinase)
MRAFVEDQATRLGAKQSVVHDAALASDEAVCNLVTHGYGHRGGPIDLSVERSGADLIVRIRDQAPAFDPTNYPAPDLSVPLEKRRPGGFGIFLIRQVMDEVLYRQLPDGRNELVLVRRDAFQARASAKPAV